MSLGPALDDDSPVRQALVPAAAVLGALRAKPGLRFLDAAAGSGAYFFPVLEAMQGQGIFLAAQLDEERLRRFLGRLEDYSAHPGYGRVEVVRAKPDRLPLPEACVDRVLLVQAWHRQRDRLAYLRELHRLLAPGGLLCLVDWRPASELGPAASAERLGPVDEARVPETRAAHLLQDAGFGLPVSHAGFDQHWCLTARR